MTTEEQTVEQSPSLQAVVENNDLLGNFSTAGLKASKAEVLEKQAKPKKAEKVAIIEKVEEKPDEAIKEEEDEQHPEEVKAEDVSHETTDEKPKLTDAEKKHLEWLQKDDDETPATGTETDKLKSEIKAEIPKEYLEYEEKAKSYEKVMSNPIFKALEAFFIQGKTDLNEFVQTIGVLDVDKMTAEEVYRSKFEGNKNYTSDEVQEAVDAFLDEPSWKQKEIIAPIRESLKRSAEDKLKSFTVGAQEKIVQDERIVQQEATKAVNMLDKWLKVNTEGTYYGMRITAKIADQIKDGVMRNARPDPVTGSYDIEKAIENEIFLNPKLRKKLLRDNIALARVEGFDEAMSARVRTNRRESAPGGATPAPGRDVTKAIQGMGTVKDAPKK